MDFETHLHGICVDEFRSTIDSKSPHYMSTIPPRDLPHSSQNKVEITSASYEPRFLVHLQHT